MDGFSHSLTNVRDLRFLPAFEMTEGSTQRILHMRHNLQGERELTQTGLPALSMSEMKRNILSDQG